MATSPRTLVINCTRFGDLLQTQPLASGLALQGRSVGILCLENFLGAARLLRDVDYVVPAPAAKALAALDRQWPQALEQLWTFRDRLHAEFPPDAILNLTASLPSRLLSRFLSLGQRPPAPEQGFCLDSWGFSRTDHPWVAFLLASTRRRGCSPFNLVDSFWKSAGLPDIPRPNALKVPDDDAMQAVAPLFDTATGVAPGAAGYVGLQLGASDDRRRWPIGEFAALAKDLWQAQGLVPVVLGSPGEVPLAQRFVEVYRALEPDAPVLVATGKTSLTELAALLTRLRLLVTNDTGTMHLAAGLGVDIASVFLITAQPWDTGPYRPGSLSLEPDLPCHPCAYGTTCPRDHQCRHVIAGATLATAVERFLAVGRWEPGPFAGARAWVSRVDMEEGGFMTLDSLTGHEDADRTRWIRLQRRMYRRFLDGLALHEDAAAGNAGARVSLSPAASAAVHAEIREALGLLTLLDGQLQALQRAPLEPIKRKFLATWERLQALWEHSAHFNVLGYMFANAGQELGADLPAVARLLAGYKALLAAWDARLT